MADEPEDIPDDEEIGENTPALNALRLPLNSFVSVSLGPNTRIGVTESQFASICTDLLTDWHHLDDELIIPKVSRRAFPPQFRHEFPELDLVFSAIGSDGLTVGVSFYSKDLSERSAIHPLPTQCFDSAPFALWVSTLYRASKMTFDNSPELEGPSLERNPFRHPSGTYCCAFRPALS